MKILVSGGGGFVGGELVPALERAGHEVALLTRPQPSGSPSTRGICWQPETGEIDKRALLDWGQADAVVHLAGEGIASGRWTEARKKRIRRSRVVGTRLLCESLGLSGAPDVFICASAIGYYGDRGDEILVETSAPGDDFLARLAIDWENACEPMRRAGIRVAHLRFGLILSGRPGGALSKMLLPFKLGLGGRLGSGRQWMSWIALEDVIEAFQKVLADRRLQGPLNVASPHPIRNADFARALGKALHRPAFMAVPSWALKATFGEIANSLLSSQRALPRRLEDEGFSFKYPHLDEILGREPGA